MRTTSIGSIILATMAVSASIAGCQSNPSNPIAEPSINEGLVPVETKSVNAVYRRPEATLSGYNKLLLRPIEVQFAKNWNPASGGSALYQMSSVDREKIRTDLSQAFADIVRNDLEKGGYPLVSEPDADVLEIRAAIVNLYITAPDVSRQAAGRSRVYTTDAGEMTLIVQLHDSVTGELLARAYDRRSASRGGLWTWTTSITNTAEARRILSSWAGALRNALDASRAES